jgi:hypothetical protein
VKNSKLIATVLVCLAVVSASVVEAGDGSFCRRLRGRQTTPCCQSAPACQVTPVCRTRPACRTTPVCKTSCGNNYCMQDKPIYCPGNPIVCANQLQRDLCCCARNHTGETLALCQQMAFKRLDYCRGISEQATLSLAPHEVAFCLCDAPDYGCGPNNPNCYYRCGFSCPINP